MTKQFKITLVVLLIAAAVLVVGNYFFQQWWGIKMQKIALGMAENKFPWRDYTLAELNKMYPQIRYADVPTRVTPEQTYAKFRQALKENNLELALEQLAKESGRYRENVNDLQQAHKEGRFISSLKLYPEKIWRSNFGQSIGNLCYEQERDNGKFVGCTVFTKDANGDWKMDNL